MTLDRDEILANLVAAETARANTAEARIARIQELCDEADKPFRNSAGAPHIVYTVDIRAILDGTTT